MELSEFVQKSIEEVFIGIKNSFGKVKPTGGEIDSSHFMPIEFDIAVTTSEGVESKAGGGIKVWGVGIEGGGKKEITNSSVSRIKFQVMAQFPSSIERTSDHGNEWS